jgi:hypothetical protein
MSTPMPDATSLRIKRKLWKALLGERSWLNYHGDFRTKERNGLIGRANYTYGILRAADNAEYLGLKSVTIAEFGVASGSGLVNMIDVAEMITRETGIAFRIVGFDTGAGLPSINGYKDHPEMWNPGDFRTEDRAMLERKLGGKATMIWGNIDGTVDTFTTSLRPSSPLGFVSVDVDIYSATKSALRCLLGPPECYLPAVSMYFDDVGFFFANRWCGELAAISEFNSGDALRKIDADRSLPGSRPDASATWYRHMFAAHVLDHPARQTPRRRDGLSLLDHLDFTRRASA